METCSDCRGRSLRRGCRLTLVSQWKVNSVGAGDWMEGFYRNLRQTSDRNIGAKADALSLTDLKMMKKGCKHPFYWSRFILIGNNKLLLHSATRCRDE